VLPGSASTQRVPRLITFGALTPHFAGGVNISFLRNDEGEARIRAAYGSHFERLALARLATTRGTFPNTKL